MGKYVEAGQKEFTDALAEAKEVLADGSTDRKKSTRHGTPLVTAMETLRLKADKSVLEDLLNEASGMDLDSYTEESAAALSGQRLHRQKLFFADSTLTVEISRR